MPQTPPDTDLATCVSAGDPSAFEQVFDRHATTIYNYCFRRTASWDAAQDYAECDDQLVGARFPEAGATTGRPAIEKGPAMTVVVSADERTYVCHLAPELNAVAAAEDDVQISGRHARAGGRLPEGTTGPGYGFGPDQAESAVVHDGWWAMQLVDDEPITGASMQWGEMSAEEGQGGGLSGDIGPCAPDDPDC